MNIYVANLSFDLQGEDLKELFSAYGEVRSANIIMDKATNRSRGFGFVEMDDEAAAKKAIAELDGTSVENRAIKVNEAKPREEGGSRGNSPFRSNNGGGGNSSGYNNKRSYNENRY